MLRRCLIAFLVVFGTPASASAQGPEAGRVATIVVAHGGDSLWNALVVEAAARARTGGPVDVSFLMGPGAKTRRFQDIAARLEAQGATEIIVVPMLVSSHSGHYEQVRYLVGDTAQLHDSMLHHLHMAGIERARVTVPMHLTRAMDDAPQVARVLTDRALELAPDATEHALLIVGHGPTSAEDYAAWMTNLRVIADSVRRHGRFADVRVELVRDDAPKQVRAEAVLRARELIEMQHRITGKPVLVVPVLVSKGTISRDKIPNDLAGLPIKYAGEPLLPHLEMSRWIEHSVRQARSRGAPLRAR
jgi:sirohydrochlorin cobaltochelatase